MDEMERNLFAIEKELSVHRTIQDSSVLEPFWRGGEEEGEEAEDEAEEEEEEEEGEEEEDDE